MLCRVLAVSRNYDTIITIIINKGKSGKTECYEALHSAQCVSGGNQSKHIEIEKTLLVFNKIE